LLNESSFNLRCALVPQDDHDALKRLQARCGNPIFNLKNQTWDVEFCVMNETEFRPMVEKYKFSGMARPFRIIKGSVEILDFDPPIVLKYPAPR
jgi:hypothetical protein